MKLLDKLLKACSDGNAAVVESLTRKRFVLSPKIDVNATAENGVTALFVAAHAGHMDIAMLLIEKGANLNAREKNGATALIAASVGRQPQIAKLLIEKGADVNLKDS